MALLISAAGSVLGALVLTPVKWLWSKIRGQPTVQAHDQAIAVGQEVGGSAVAGGAGVLADRGGTAVSGATIHAQPGATVNVYAGDLLEAKPPDVHGPFSRGRALQANNEHEAAIDQFYSAFTSVQHKDQRAALHIHIGNSFLELGLLAEAEGHFREARRLATDVNTRDMPDKRPAAGGQP